MTKITVHADTPTESILKAARQLAFVTDLQGRKIGLRRLDFIEEFRILETVGPQLSANPAYINMLAPLLHIAEIDGEPVEIPRTKLQVDALIQRAGREGFLAALEGVKEHFSEGSAALEEKIKNVAGTPGSATDCGS